MKIHGIVIARNEWPLLGLSISHALFYHVDKVFVVDHASTDDTRNGLAELQKIWPDRIEVFRYENPVFDQETLNNTFLHISNQENPDWNFIFDADEFLVSPTKKNLKDLLSGIGQRWNAIAIQLENYIVPLGFADTKIDDYKLIDHYVESTNHIVDRDEFYARVKRNENLLHEFRVPSKVMVKNTSEDFVDNGQHQLKYGDGKLWELWDTTVAASNKEDWIICHLPYTSLNRFMARKNVHQRSNNEFSKKVFAKTITPNEDVNQMWDRLQMHPGDTNPVLISSTIFSESFAPLAEKLAPHWEKIVSPSQANVVYRISSEAIELAVSIARKYANKCNKLWANQKGERSE
jgi:glycosyltransferase involved in cell wall biosynthesis